MSIFKHCPQCGFATVPSKLYDEFFDCEFCAQGWNRCQRCDKLCKEAVKRYGAGWLCDECDTAQENAKPNKPMPLTPEQQESNIEALRAFWKGEPIEQFFSGEWANSYGGLFEGVAIVGIFRAKPKPKTLPWDCAEDVPLNAWVRFHGDIHGNTFDGDGLFVTGISKLGCQTSVEFLEWQDLQKNYQFSIDRKTWLPCQKTVTE